MKKIEDHRNIGKMSQWALEIWILLNGADMS